MKTKEQIIEKVKQLPVKGPGRIFPEELKNDIVKMYKETRHGQKINFADKLDLNQNVIMRWTRNRNDRRKVGRPRKSKSTSLHKPSIAAGGRTIGTSLSIILANKKNSDILQQVTIVDTLEEAGYKREAVIEKIDGPSMEDLTKIMDAVKLLSKEYNITKKEVR